MTGKFERLAALGWTTPTPAEALARLVDTAIAATRHAGRVIGPAASQWAAEDITDYAALVARSLPGALKEEKDNAT